MCEYCLSSHGHLPGCPNAPEPEIIGKCYKCGAVIEDGDKYEDTIHGYLCEKCLEKEEHEEYVDDLIERDTARKPRKTSVENINGLTMRICACGKALFRSEIMGTDVFCSQCGQRIDWGD